MTYAAKTTVSVERTRIEIERRLFRYGADGFRYSYRPGLAMVEFAARGRLVRFTLPLPKREDFALTQHGQQRSDGAVDAAWEQSCRQRWRALLLAITAKLEAVESGIAQFEEEFLAYVVDPETNRTVAEVIRPQLQRSYDAAPAPLLLTAETAVGQTEP